MQYTFDRTSRGLVVRLHGAVQGGADASSWHDALRQHCASGRRRVAVDCHEVDTIDAAGLGAIVAALAILRNAGGDLAIARVPDALRSLLLITRLLDVLPPHDSVEAAFHALAASPRTSSQIPKVREPRRSP